MGLLYIKHCDKLFSSENTLQDSPPPPLLVCAFESREKK